MIDQPRLVLTLSCPDVAGLVAAVSTFLFQAGAFAVESADYGDPDTGLFFMRTVFRGEPNGIKLAVMRESFASLGRRFNMTWTLEEADRPMPVVIAVSRFGHCLNDLLHRWRSGALPVEIKAVVSNHEDMRGIVEWHGLPYHYLPTGDKPAQEARFLEIVRNSGAELTVLARYMQILSAEMAGALSGRCINIHHSFLPSFKGAKPYHQAHARGVKIIGATAHYVTADLDEGPIIEQAVERVDHRARADQLVAIGSDIEAIVLARAVTWHAERRVLMNGKRTVVLR
ncbi:MAG: Formyltetrahydrofolate deformylase [Caulobacteraceae bacterium]|nr:Formyltetrahydrofolate deformylase [Caulobacteraceae bacterium]